MTIHITKRWAAVLLAAILVAAGALIAFGLTTTHRASAQDNPNSQPDTSKYGLSSGSVHTSAAPKTVLWAVVNSNGSLARGRGALRAKLIENPGGYAVYFDRNVRKCVYTATIGLAGVEGVSPPGQISVVGRVGATNGVFVQTTDSAGAPSNRGFHLALNCPAT